MRKKHLVKPNNEIPMLFPSTGGSAAAVMCKNKLHSRHPHVSAANAQDNATRSRASTVNSMNGILHTIRKSPASRNPAVEFAPKRAWTHAELQRSEWAATLKEPKQKQTKRRATPGLGEQREGNRHQEGDQQVRRSASPPTPILHPCGNKQCHR